MGSEACSGVPSLDPGASPPRTDCAPGTAAGLTPAPRELVGPWVCRCATCGCDGSERCPLAEDGGLEGWRGQWPFCRDSSAPTAPLALPLPLSRGLVWAFLLGPLAQPSLLETFLSLSPFPATCLLLPAGLGSHQRLRPHTRPPGLPGGRLLFSYFPMQIEKALLPLSFLPNAHTCQSFPASGFCGLPRQKGRRTS